MTGGRAAAVNRTAAASSVAPAINSTLSCHNTS